MLRRLVASLAVLAAAPALAACGKSDINEEHTTKGESEGIYVNVDHLKYQVQISRVLNPNDAEDRAYVAGVSNPAEAELEGEEEWFGVFLRVQNRSEEETHKAADDSVIEDPTGAGLEPVPLDPRRTPLAYQAGDVGPLGFIPALDSIPQTTTTAGALLLFKIPRQNLENRPLELRIKSLGGEPEEAVVDLDV